MLQCFLHASNVFEHLLKPSLHSVSVCEKTDQCSSTVKSIGVLFDDCALCYYHLQISFLPPAKCLQNPKIPHSKEILRRPQTLLVMYYLSRASSGNILVLS